MPQARVLAVLMPGSPDDHPIDWLVVTHRQLALRAGYTGTSGSITRALNGIRPGSSSGEPHMGLLGLGYVEEVILDIDGVSEVDYRITAAGIRAYQAHVAAHGEQLPEVKAAELCVNNRYMPTVCPSGNGEGGGR